MGHVERKFQREAGRPPTNFGVRKLESYLSRGVVCVILRLAVLIKYRRVTHRQTHDDGCYPRIACDARVKIGKQKSKKYNSKPSPVLNSIEFAQTTSGRAAVC